MRTRTHVLVSTAIFPALLLLTACIVEPEPDDSSPTPGTPTPVAPTDAPPTAAPATPTSDTGGDDTPENTGTPAPTPPNGCGAFEVPSTNHWLAYEAPEDLKGRGHRIGDVIPNFTLLDQFNQEVSLYQFYGSAIVIDFSAMWCAPCHDAASVSQALLESYDGQCVTFITVMFENVVAEVPSVEDLQSWATQYGLDYPILSDDEEIWVEFEASAIPSYYFIDREMVLQSKMSGYDEQDLKRNMKKIL